MPFCKLVNRVSIPYGSEQDQNRKAKRKRERKKGKIWIGQEPALVMPVFLMYSYRDKI